MYIHIGVSHLIGLITRYHLRWFTAVNFTGAFMGHCHHCKSVDGINTGIYQMPMDDHLGILNNLAMES